MFPEVFLFILNCIKQVFGVFTKFEIAPGFNYLSFLIGLSGIVLVIELLKTVRKDTQEERNWLANKERNKEYNAYQSKLKEMEKRGK